MNDGLDPRIHDLMSPFFHLEQITQMNYDSPGSDNSSAASFR
jgi:hypothetical protein